MLPMIFARTLFIRSASAERRLRYCSFERQFTSAWAMNGCRKLGSGEVGWNGRNWVEEAKGKGIGHRRSAEPAGQHPSLREHGAALPLTGSLKRGQHSVGLYRRRSD